MMFYLEYQLLQNDLVNNLWLLQSSACYFKRLQQLRQVYLFLQLFAIARVLSAYFHVCQVCSALRCSTVMALLLLKPQCKSYTYI